MAFFSEAKSGHIVGAHMSYGCEDASSNTYRVNLTVYRDCFSLSFDIALKVAIYDDFNNLIMELPMQRGTPETIPPEVTTHPCAISPPTICVQSVVYTGIVQLPPIQGGYHISWQRCCRSSVIQNVNGSANYGLTSTVKIPSMDTICNNSASLASIIPPVICVNNALDYTIDVIDQDGDSLSFRLCDLYAGGGGTAGTANCTTISSIPSPACPPPYVVIPFSGIYDAQNPIPSSVPISLDPLTGQLTGMPNQQGNFVIGICVDEFRDGLLINTLRIDYQLNSVGCLYTKSDMVTPLEDTTMLCHGLEVNFTSESINAMEYFWNFGDLSSLGDTSIINNPTYIFPQAGQYTVQHIAIGKADECNDTVEVVLNVINEVFPEFDWFGKTCFENHEIEFFAQGIYPDSVEFRWIFGQEANFDTLYQRIPPKIIWNNPGNHVVQLRVDYGTCYNEYSETITIFDFQLLAGAGPDQNAKPGATINLEAFGGTSYYWSSDKPSKMASRFSQSTSVTIHPDSKNDTITFYVRITNKDGCEKLDSVKVFINSAFPQAPHNFFTPNGDGLNDFFELGNLDKQGCAITIMNRWGTMVWESDNYQNDWGGKNLGGDDLPDGTYYYLLSCNEEVVYKSAVTLVRETGN